MEGHASRSPVSWNDRRSLQAGLGHSVLARLQSTKPHRSSLKKRKSDHASLYSLLETLP